MLREEEEGDWNRRLIPSKLTYDKNLSMRYAITYLTNKIVDAEDVSLTLDEKLRIICPVCQHPLTYVEPIRNVRHFRHPRRSEEDLVDPSLQCEARVSQISTQAVRAYNRIIDQTNIQVFQRHFYRIVVTALLKREVDKREASKWIRAMKDLINSKETVSLLAEIDEYCVEYQGNVLQEHADITAKVKSRLKDRPFKARLATLRDLVRRVEPGNDYCHALHELEVERILEPANRTLVQMINWYDNEGHKKYSENILEEYWSLMANVMQMLSHKKSTEMRHFALAFHGQVVIANMVEQGGDVDWNRRDSIVYLIARYMATARLIPSERDKSDRSLREMAIDINSLLASTTGICDYLGSIGEMMTIPEPEDWLKVIAKINANDAWDDFNDRSGFVYIAFNRTEEVACVKKVKIGKAKDIEKRQANYQTYSPDGFAFYNVYSVCDRHGAEKFIHHNLKDYQIKGKGGQEWYELTLEEADAKVQQYVSEYMQKTGYFRDSNQRSSPNGFG